MGHEVFLNGKFVPEAEATISVFDRGFMYGDGLFETIPIFNGKPFLLERHLARFRLGAQCLHLKVPHAEQALVGLMGEFIARNDVGDAMLRLQLSRGSSVRGYSTTGAHHPTFVMSLHPAPKRRLDRPTRWQLMTASIRLPVAGPLSAVKSANRLPQILARAEADSKGVDEALILSNDGWVAETTGANIFWQIGGQLCTPPVSTGVLPGVTREFIITLAEKLEIDFRETMASPETLLGAEGVFLTLSSFGIVEITSLDDRPFGRGNLTTRLYQSYLQALPK